MRISTRLIVLLTIVIGLVMLAGGWFILRGRERVLENAMHNEVRAHALTLQIALEGLFRSGRDAEAQQLIDSLGRNPRVYGVLLFDGGGRISMVSNPLAVDEVLFPEEVMHVLKTSQTMEQVRRIRQQEVFSIIMPIRVGQTPRGAFEIAQPMAVIRADFARARRDIGLITLALFATMIVVVYAVMRQAVVRPISELLRGAAAVGRGALDHRVSIPGRGSEFAQLASEFNRMADKLGEQRLAADRAAAQRLQLEQQLRHNERLASVGRLAAGVAHEIGTPLNVIDARAEQLGQAAGTAERRERNAAIIRTQVDRIARIVRQLLNLARPYDFSPETVDLCELVAATLEMLDTRIRESSVRVVFTPPGRIEVTGDREFLRQVFINIVVNALQAMPEGGDLRISCLADAGAPASGQGYAAMRFADSGPGIPAEHLPHLFDPFYTTRDIGHGAGLGLAVSHRIIEEHGGWIEAENNSGPGASFTVYLPAGAGAPAGADVPEPGETILAQGGGPRPLAAVRRQAHKGN
ncbi:MAG: sensor histidine kinase [Blastocatellia bacterium]